MADGGEDTWAVDAALGVASLLARTVGAVGASAPGRAVTQATRRLASPLAREGQDVREQLEEEATPAARRLVAQVTPRVAEVVDLDEILAMVDLDQLLARVDLDAVLRRIDLDQLLAGIDVSAVVQRIDVNAVLAAVDVEELVAGTEIGGLLAMSSSSVLATGLDAVRSWVVGADEAVARLVDRILRRDVSASPLGPVLLVQQVVDMADVVVEDPLGVAPVVVAP